MHARDLERHMKSKKQLYACLTMEGNPVTTDSTLGQIYLPPESDCTVVFMQQIMAGKKKVSRPHF